MGRFLPALFLGALYLVGIPGEGRAQTKCVPNPINLYPNAARTGKCLKKPRATTTRRGALLEQQRRAMDALRLEQEARITEIRMRNLIFLSDQKARNRIITRRRTR